jgi:hypothetical protein
LQRQRLGEGQGEHAEGARRKPKNAKAWARLEAALWVLLLKLLLVLGGLADERHDPRDGPSGLSVLAACNRRSDGVVQVHVRSDGLFRRPKVVGWSVQRGRGSDNAYCQSLGEQQQP